jgi:hypothetical protein
MPSIMPDIICVHGHHRLHLLGDIRIIESMCARIPDIMVMPCPMPMPPKTEH